MCSVLNITLESKKKNKLNIILNNSNCFVDELNKKNW